MKPADFIKIAAKDYKKVGSITVSSKYTVKKVVSYLKPEYKYIIEYGAGSGTTTKKILDHISADGKVVAIELNKDLLSELGKIKDPRLIILNEDVTVVSDKLHSLGLPRIDAVVSNIPMSFIKKSDRKRVMENTFKAIVKGGRFIVYQYSLMALPLLKSFFKKTSYYLEIRNLPPYFIMVGEKQ